MIEQASNDADDLKRENAELRRQLARVTSEVELYRSDAYRQTEHETPPSEEEIMQLLAEPHEQGLMRIIEEFESRISG